MVAISLRIEVVCGLRAIAELELTLTFFQLVLPVGTPDSHQYVWRINLLPAAFTVQSTYLEGDVPLVAGTEA